MCALLLTALLWFVFAVIVFAMLLRMLPNSLDGKRYVPLIVAIMPSIHPFSSRPSKQGLWNKSLDSIAQLQHYDNDLNNVHVEMARLKFPDWKRLSGRSRSRTIRSTRPRGK